jgi:NitT/TauT family transport system permease protein
MSKVKTLTVASPSPQYLAWLARERRGHLIVRLTQLAVLVVFLVLWEVLPKALIVNPVLTSYPSAVADSRRTAQGDAAAGEHSYPHLGDGVCDRARIHRKRPFGHTALTA